MFTKQLLFGEKNDIFYPTQFDFFSLKTRNQKLGAFFCADDTQPGMA
jgi:hypothetical protein